MKGYMPTKVSWIAYKNKALIGNVYLRLQNTHIAYKKSVGGFGLLKTLAFLTKIKRLSGRRYVKGVRGSIRPSLHP